MHIRFRVCDKSNFYYDFDYLLLVIVVYCDMLVSCPCCCCFLSLSVAAVVAFSRALHLVADNIRMLLIGNCQMHDILYLPRSLLRIFSFIFFATQ